MVGSVPWLMFIYILAPKASIEAVLGTFAILGVGGWIAVLALGRGVIWAIDGLKHDPPAKAKG